MEDYLFVTGMPRSGTTLIEKILSMHPHLHILSQPLPLLYVQVKKAFIQSQNGLADLPFPLNDMFAENHYDPQILLDYLGTFQLQADWCQRVLNEMIDYDGQYTKPPVTFSPLEDFEPGSLFSFVSSYCRRLVGAENPCLIGSKETSCEEFIPYFLDCNARVLHIVRDPRDTIASLNTGRGRHFAGHLKPHLFNVRQWRKSVAIGIAYAEQRNFKTCAYERLVTEPDITTHQICQFLEVAPFGNGLRSVELRSQSGEIWYSNSSHSQSSMINTGSVGRYERALLEQESNFIQACCIPELIYLDYSVDMDLSSARACLNNSELDEELERDALQGYIWNDERRQEELRRLDLLESGQFDPKFFPFEASFRALRRSLGLF